MRLLLVALLASACSRAPSPTAARAAITGGSVDDGDEAVVGLVTQVPLCGAGAGSLQLFCTGTLIAPRVVLTAGHCTSTYPLVGSRVYVGRDVATDPGQLLEVAEVRLYPGWTPMDPRTNDVALLVLEEPAPIAPVPPFDQPLDASLVNATVRVAGFGVDENGHLGVKRQGTAKVTGLGMTTFDIAASPAMSCEGDSGGPVLIDVGGQSRLLGVTSFGDLACTIGTNSRIDAYLAGFIAPILAEVAQAGGPRAAIQPGFDTCTAGCSSDADCPRGTSCRAGSSDRKACALSGLPPGRFGQSCTSQDGCPGGQCVEANGAGCLCYQLCDAPPPQPAGCSVARSELSSVGTWSIVALGLMLALRRRMKAGIVLLLLAGGGSLVGGCHRPRGNCPDGAVSRGEPPPKGSLQYCELAGNNLRHGPLTEWYPNKTPPQKKREGSYANGKLEGKWVSYFDSGKVERESTYVNGVLDGEVREYYPDGKPKEQGVVKNGLRVGTWTMFHEGGTKWKETAYSDNSNTQRWTVWSESGIKTNEGVFVNGLKHGPFAEYYPNGQKVWQGTYVEGKKQGKWQAWDESGKLTKEEEFFQDQLVAPKR